MSKLSTDIIEKILSDNPNKESSTLSKLITKNDLSLDEAIKTLENNADITYLVSKLLSIKNLDKMYGINKLINNYVDNTIRYNNIGKEAKELYKWIKLYDVWIYVELGPNRRRSLFNNNTYFEVCTKNSEESMNEILRDYVINEFTTRFGEIRTDYNRYGVIFYTKDCDKNQIFIDLKILNSLLDPDVSFIDIKYP